MVLLWMPHATKSLFVQYCAHKFEYFAPKKLSDVSILYNNGHLHVVQPVVNLFIDYTRETLCHSAYSPDLSPLNFNFFQKLREPLRGTQFGNLEKLSLAITH